MDDMMKKITDAAEKILNGGSINVEEASELIMATGSDIILLCAYANKIREAFSGNEVDLCSVINAKSGNCSEDCAFCAQSAHHSTAAPCHPIIDKNDILEKAIAREKAGARHCDIATSGLGFTGEEEDFQRILRAFRLMKQHTSLKLCACLGTLNESSALALAECGVERYSHNLESAQSFYPNIVTTHTYEERVDTLRVAKKAGLELCSGMIIGMGETPLQRLEHTFLLRELDVDSIPVNILIPIKGTKLEGNTPLDPLEILKTFAVIRFILPDKTIRFAGGRETGLKSLQPLGLVSGVNGMLIGDYLTASGQTVSKDMDMLQALHLNF